MTFRMTRACFNRLGSHMRSALTRNVRKNGRSDALCVSTKLAVTLRMLAGSTYLDVQWTFKICSATVYNVFHDTVDQLVHNLRMEPDAMTDTTILEQRALEFKTSRKRGSPFDGCVGALDGIAIPIEKPRDVPNPASFYNRKGYYALPVQAVVDARCRFISFSSNCVGSTHDAVAHAMSSLGRLLKTQAMPLGFWIAADDAYKCSNYGVTPFSSTLNGAYEEGFNFYQSSLRMHIEQAFGILKRRWGILWKPLGFSIEANRRIVCAAMLLHNFCIHNKPMPSEMDCHGGVEAMRTAKISLQKWHKEVQNADPQSLLGADRSITKALMLKRCVDDVLVRPSSQPSPTSALE